MLEGGNFQDISFYHLCKLESNSFSKILLNLETALLALIEKKIYTIPNQTKCAVNAVKNNSINWVKLDVF